MGVLDDDENFVESTCLLLKILGFQVHYFHSVADFLQSTAVKRLDCLILDVDMPDTNGPTLYDTLRKQGVTLPVVFCTGLSLPELNERGLTETDAPFVRKPFSRKELENTIRSVCGFAGRETDSE